MSELIAHNLKMTNKIDLLVKLTESRVKDIRIGELYDIMPLAKSGELKSLNTAIKNKKGLDKKEHYEEVGAAIMIIVYRLFEEKELSKIKAWERWTETNK